MSNPREFRWRGLGVWVLAIPLLGACSLIFNPNNLPPAPSPPDEAGSAIDAPIDPDAEFILDANPDSLHLDSVEPAELVEGQGVGGSYPTILVIHGMHLVKSAATTVTISVHGETTAIAGIAVDNTRLDISANGRDLAVPVAFAVHITKGATERARVDVTVTQMGAGGLVSASLTMAGGDVAVPALELQYLDELTIASPDLVANAIAPGLHRYSSVDIASGGITAATIGDVIRIRAVSSISIIGEIVVSGAASAGGPGAGGGGLGGAPPVTGSNPGGAGNGPSPGRPSSSGGGFGSLGMGAMGGGIVGDAALRTLAAPNRGSGGSGGAGNFSIGDGRGGAGGGGGGSIELTAGGNLMIGALSAKGGSGSIGGAGGGGAGGGGSGGAVLLRARNMVVTTAVSAIGGTPGGGGAGGGGDGRVRVDVPTNPFTPMTTPVAFRGPMLAADSNLISRTDHPMFVVIGEKNHSFTYFFTNSRGDMTQSGDAQLVGIGGSQSFRLPAEKPLFRGINHFCLLVEGATAASPAEAMNCFDVVYLYTP